MTRSTPMVRPISILRVTAALVLVVAAAALGAGGAAASSASANAVCWQRVLHDWFVDGRIDGTYPPKCLGQAMAHIPADAKEYSNFQDEAKRALATDERWQRDHRNRKPHYNMSPSGGHNGGNFGPPSLHPGSGGGGGPGPSASGGGGGAINDLFQSGQPSDPSSIPVPLLVLGGVAILLLLLAAASFAARRIQARRLQAAPAPAPAPGEPKRR